MVAGGVKTEYLPFLNIRHTLVNFVKIFVYPLKYINIIIIYIIRSFEKDLFISLPVIEYFNL